MVNIKDLDKAKVLLELYNNSQQQGLGVFAPKVDLSLEDCRKLLESQTDFDYLHGKVMKVDLSSDEEFDEWLYDRDNGDGKAQEVVNAIRKNLEKRSKVVKVENKLIEEKEEDYRPDEYVFIGEDDEDKKRLLYPVDFSRDFVFLSSGYGYSDGFYPPREWSFSFRGIDLETGEGIKLTGSAYESSMPMSEAKPWFCYSYDILFSEEHGMCVADVKTGDVIPSYNETKEVYNELKQESLSNEEITKKMLEWARKQEFKKSR